MHINTRSPGLDERKVHLTKTGHRNGHCMAQIRRNACGTMNASWFRVLVFLLLTAFSSKGVIHSQPAGSKNPDVFGNVWTFNKIKRDTPLPAGKWKTFASDRYGFLWVGGESGLIRLDPRNPYDGWKYFEADDDYKGGPVQALNSPVDGMMRVTLKGHEIYEVDIDSKGKQIAHKIAEDERVESPVSWKALSPMPYSSHDVFGAELDGKIYIPGGQAPHGFPATLQTFGRIFIYDTQCDSWQLSSPMKINRRYCSVGILKGKIWVVGGYTIDGSNERTGTVEIYDPAADSWSDGPGLDAPCAQSVAAVVNERLYVIYSNEEKTISYTVSISDGETAWRSEPPPPYPVFQTDGCEVDHKICINIPAIGLIMYDPSSQSWQKNFPALTGTKAPRAAAVVNYMDDVWVISGADVEDEKMVWIYSPEERKWTRGPSVPKSIRWADGIEVYGKLYIFGGAGYSERHELFMFWNTIYTLIN